MYGYMAFNKIDTLQNHQIRTEREYIKLHFLKVCMHMIIMTVAAHYLCLITLSRSFNYRACSQICSQELITRV